MRFLLITASLAAVAAPASAQTFLDKVIGKLVKPAAAQQHAAVATITPAQSAAIDRLLAAPLDDPKVAADRAAAAPLLRTVLATAACAQNSGAFNALNRYSLTPVTYQAGESAYAPMGQMNYHDKQACVDVTRLANWSKPALNAMKVEAYFVAADSGQAAHQTYTLQKSSDEQWLIREISWAL